MPTNEKGVDPREDGRTPEVTTTIVSRGWTLATIVASGVVCDVAVIHLEDPRFRRLVFVADLKTQRGIAVFDQACEAARVVRPRDTSELHGRRVEVRVRGNRVVDVRGVGS